MTKYILHGGLTRIKNKFNFLFFKEILKNLKEPVKILLVLFARKEKDWPLRQKREIKHFRQSNPNKNVEFTIANKNTVTLIRQIKNSDVVYLLGGSPSLLKKEMGKVKNLKKLFNKKVVVGSSAGAYILSKYYFSKSEGGIGKGLNILPIKTIAHYDKKFKKELQNLKDYKEKLKTYAIAETKYIVIHSSD